MQSAGQQLGLARHPGAHFRLQLLQRLIFSNAAKGASPNKGKPPCFKGEERGKSEKVKKFLKTVEIGGKICYNELICQNTKKEPI